MAGHRGEISSVGGMAQAKRQRQESTGVFKGPLEGTVAAWSQLSAGLSLNLIVWGWELEGVLGFRKT